MTEFTIADLIPSLLELWKNKWILLLIALSGLFAGLSLTANDSANISYRALSSVCVTYTTYQDQLRGSSTLTNYSALVSSLLVCERAAELLEGTDLTAADIQSMLESWVGGNSYVLYITATTSKPELAVEVANAVAEAFIEKTASVSGNNSLQILDLAYDANTVTASSTTTILITTALPLLLACAWIVIREQIGGRIRILSQCADDPDELLCILPDMK